VIDIVTGASPEASNCILLDIALPPVRTSMISRRVDSKRDVSVMQYSRAHQPASSLNRDPLINRVQAAWTKNPSPLDARRLDPAAEAYRAVMPHRFPRSYHGNRRCDRP